MLHALSKYLPLSNGYMVFTAYFIEVEEIYFQLLHRYEIFQILH